jgi:hypothetical protein
MTVNLDISTVDVVILLILIALMILAIRIIFGFFHEK